MFEVFQERSGKIGAESGKRRLYLRLIRIHSQLFNRPCLLIIPAINIVVERQEPCRDLSSQLRSRNRKGYRIGCDPSIVMSRAFRAGKTALHSFQQPNPFKTLMDICSELCSSMEEIPERGSP